MSDLPNSAMGALRLMPSKAKEVASFVTQIVRSVKNGDANAMEVLVLCRALEHVSREVREEIEENIMAEADRYSEKKFDAFGAIVEKAEVRTDYNYLGSGDVEYEQMYYEMQSLKDKMKNREEFLRTLKEPMTAVHEPTGEVYKISPPFKTSKSGIKVYIK